MPKDFWQDVSDAYNLVDADDKAAATTLVLDLEDVHFQEVNDCLLEDFEQMEKDHLKKKVNRRNHGLNT